MNNAIDNRTPGLGLPLPHPDNELHVDALRLREAILLIEQAISAKADVGLLEQRIAQVVDGSPGVLDTLREIAQAIENDPNFSVKVVRLVQESKQAALLATALAL